MTVASTPAAGSMSVATYSPSRPSHRRDRQKRDVLTLVARGLSNTEIAGHLHLSPATVKTYIGRLLTKLGARDRAQLVIIAYESGLITTR